MKNSQNISKTVYTKSVWSIEYRNDEYTITLDQDSTCSSWDTITIESEKKGEIDLSSSIAEKLIEMCGLNNK